MNHLAAAGENAWQLLRHAHIVAHERADAGDGLLTIYICYQVFRSLRRHDDPSMMYLAMGLILLTTVTYTFTFLASVLIQLRWITLTQQDYFLTVAHLLQFTGLVFLAYALHRR